MDDRDLVLGLLVPTLRDLAEQVTVELSDEPPDEPEGAPLAVACQLGARIVEEVDGLRGRSDDPFFRRQRAGNPRTVTDLGTCLHDAAVDLGILDRLDAAVPAAALAVELRRWDPAVAPLTASLLLQAELSGRAKRAGAAVAAADEAVAANRRAGTPVDLARSLDRLAFAVVERDGATPAALAALAESAAVRRPLPAETGDGRLVRLLTNAIRTQAAGVADAAAYRDDAARGYAELVAANPDSRLAALAAGLQDLVPRLAQTQSATATVIGAVIAAETIHEEVAHDWVVSLDGEEVGEAVHAPLVYALLHLAGAVAATEPPRTTHDAVEDFLRRTDVEGATFLPDVARRLDGLARSLAARGANDDALTVTTHLVGIRRWLTDPTGGMYVLVDFAPRIVGRLPVDEDLAKALDLHASRLRAAGRTDEAAAAWHEHLALHRQIAARRPDGYHAVGFPDLRRAGLAEALIKVGVRLGNMGRGEEAMAVKAEAVTYVDRCIQQEVPGEWAQQLGRALNNLADALGAAGRVDEALSTSARAVEVSRSARHRPTLALALLTFAEVRWAARRDLPAARQAITESVDTYEQLAAGQELETARELVTEMEATMT